jgi:16S rRNA pseudouridine516 synthase
MMEAVGCKVTYLKRISFGPIVLDETLEEGMYRHLREDEIELLQK